MRALSFVIVLLFSAVAFAGLKFPALTGRVVDNAHILSQNTAQTLDHMLADYERGTSNQVVVATIASLQGTTVEDYGYQLGRTWQVGQKGKNNGAIFIVVPSEHKVRIEVGYGLEPLLTDAAASAIIQDIILPDFRAGHMEQGIIDGTRAMVAVLGGNSVPSYVQPVRPLSVWQGVFLFVAFSFFLRLCWKHPVIAYYLLSTSRFGSSNLVESGWGGGGFSGGGGSFGGGGASGGW